MLPTSRTNAHGRRKADAVVQARSGVQFRRLERMVQGDCAAPQKLRLGRGRRAGAGRALRLNTTLTSLDLGFNLLGEVGGRSLGRTTALRHHAHVAQFFCNRLGEGGGRAQGRNTAPQHQACVALPGERARHCASTPRLRRSTLTAIMGEGGGRALAEALRFNTTIMSLNIRGHDLGKGRGRALAEALRLNTTVTSLDLGCNDLGEGGGRSLAETLRLNRGGSLLSWS
jgi:hypothetical protein